MAADPAFAEAPAIDVCRVPEADPGIERMGQDCVACFLAHRSEIPAQLPAAQPDFADLKARLAQSPRLHARLLIPACPMRRRAIGSPFAYAGRFRKGKDGAPPRVGQPS